MNKPRPQEIYRHFKGRYYMVLTLAQKEDTGEILVIYQAMYGSFQVYARALSSFTEELDPNKYPSAGQKYRFELVSEGELRCRQVDAEAGISMQAQTPIRTGRGSLERTAAERKTTERNSAERNSTERNSAERNSMERNSVERNSMERNSMERNSLERNSMGTAGRGGSEIRRNFAGKVLLRSEQSESAAVKNSEKPASAETDTGRTAETTGSDISAAAASRQPDNRIMQPDSRAAQQTDEEITVDPLVEEFLDAQRASQRLDILRRLHPRITDEMIDMMAISAGFEIDEGDLEERYQDLRYCLQTIDKYEQRRDRFRNNG